MSRERDQAIVRSLLDRYLPTASVDPDKVAEYVERSGDTAPPIKYVYDEETGEYYIADGNHRWFAANLRGDETIDAEPMEGDPVFLSRLLNIFRGE